MSIGRGVGEWTKNKYSSFGGANNTLFLGVIKDKFVTYAQRQRLIEKERKKQDDALYEKAKEEEEKEIINDLNLFPPKKEDTGSLTNKSTPTIDKKEPNYLLYGGIGLAILIGAILIFKKK